MVTQSAAPPEPEVISAYTHGWKQLWKNFSELLLIMVISIAIGLVVSVPATLFQTIYYNNGFIWRAFFWLFCLFIVVPILYGILYAYLKASRGDKVDIVDMFAAFRNYWNAFLATIIVSVVVFAGLLCLVFPAIYLVCKLAFVPLLVVEKKVDAFKAIELSWKMTNGVAWHVFLIVLLVVPIVLIGFICFIVGLVISIMLICMAIASLYYAVDFRTAAPPPLIADTNASSTL